MSDSRIPKYLSYPLLALIAVGGLWLGIWVSQHYSPSFGSTLPDNLEATVLREPRVLQPFELLDHDRQPFNLESFKGQWNFLFFGFVNCPDICPMTLNMMQGVWRQLPSHSDQPGHPRLYFVSVDPRRDDYDLLKQYVGYFDPSFVGVTGELDEIDKLTGQLGVLYGYDESRHGNKDDYIVNHSAQILLIDPQARLRAVISPPHDATTIAHNFQTIRHYYGD